MSSKVKATARELDRRIREISASFPEINWEDPEVYANWLAQQYYLVRHTTRFVSLGAGRMPVDNREGHQVMLHHLKGEINHDALLLRDIKTLGRDISEFTEDIETRLLCNNQYYWLDHGHPLVMNGYALMLEGFSIMVVPDVLKRLMASPYAKATSFLKLHTDSDEDHYPDGIKNLEKLPEAIMTDILANLEQSWYLYCRMVQNCAVKKSSGTQKTKAAGETKTAAGKAA